VLYAGQGLALVALLYFTYLVIAAIGFASWLRRFREAEGA